MIYGIVANQLMISESGGPPPLSENNPPINLETDAGYSWIDLSWDHHAQGMPDYYHIYRDGVQVGSVLGLVTIFEDVDLTSGQSYNYTVRSVRAGEESANSTAHARSTDVPAVTGHRLATTQDALRIKNANEGDLLITGSNWGTAQIQNNEFRGFKPTLGPGQKILVKGGTYEFIWWNMPDVIGTKENPVIITNYEGQVILKKSTDTGAPLKDRFACFGMQNFKVTGKYDPVAKTGDKRYQGHDGPWGYSFLHGRYGFVMDGNWEEGTAAFKGNQTFYEVEYTEVCNGHFAGFSLKNDETPTPLVWMDIDIHDNFLRDIFSEPFYIGKNVTNCSQHGVKGKVHHNLIVRAGTESIQFSNIINRVDVYNNTQIMSSCNWKNAFQDSQNNANQFGVKQGFFVYKGNLVWGSAKKHGDIGIVDNACDPPDANLPVLIAQNTFAFSRGRSWYLFDNTDLITPLIFDDNDFHLVDSHTNEMYIDENLTDIIRHDRDDAPVHVTNNRYTAGKTFIAGNAATVNTNNTTYTFPWAQFEGSGFHSQFNPLQYEMWAEKMGSNPQFNSQSTTYQTTPMNSSGSVNIANIVEDQVISIGYYNEEDEFVSDFPQRFGVDYWNILATKNIDLRLADPDNEYDNFAIVNLKSVNLTNNTITVSAPIVLRGSYNGQLLIDKDLAYIFYNYNPDPDLRDIVGYHSRFYRYKFSGSRYDYKGISPDLDDGTYWELLTWTRPDGTISYLPEDNWKIANSDPYYAPRLQGVGYTVDLPEDPTPPPTGDPIAFEGAMGFGRNTRGAYALYEQTGNTADLPSIELVSNVSEFKTACLLTTPRIIIPISGGTWDLKVGTDYKVVVDNPYLTIAGLPTPGDGLCIKGVMMFYTGEIIVRNVRFRLHEDIQGLESGSEDTFNVRGSTIRGVGEVNNLMFDRISISWGSDENVGMGGTDKLMSNITFQNFLIYEGTRWVDGTTHSGKGALVGNGVDTQTGEENISFHRGFFLHNPARNPRYGGEARLCPATVTNVISYNWKQTNSEYCSLVNADIVYCKNKAGLETTNTNRAICPRPDGTLPVLHVEGVNNPLGVNHVSTQLGTHTPAGGRQFPDVYASDLVEDYGSTLETDIKSTAGAWPRDAADSNVLTTYDNGTGNYIQNCSEVGGFPTLTSGTYPSHNNGVHLSWLVSKGYAADNTAAAALTSTFLKTPGNGNTQYAIIEEFINDVDYHI